MRLLRLRTSLCSSNLLDFKTESAATSGKGFSVFIPQRTQKPMGSQKELCRLSGSLAQESDVLGRPKNILNDLCAREIFKLKHMHGCASLHGASIPLARKYGVSSKAIRDIWNGRSWLHATSDLWEDGDRPQRRIIGRPKGRKDSTPRTRKGRGKTLAEVESVSLPPIQYGSSYVNFDFLNSSSVGPLCPIHDSGRINLKQSIKSAAVMHGLSQSSLITLVNQSAVSTEPQNTQYELPPIRQVLAGCFHRGFLPGRLHSDVEDQLPRNFKGASSSRRHFFAASSSLQGIRPPS